MAQRREIIPIHLGLNKSVEEVGLKASSAALYDCVIDVTGDDVVINRRPGLKELCDTGESASVDGLFWWEPQDKMIVVCNSKVFTIDDSSGSLTELTGSYFDAGVRAIMDDAGTAVYGADKGKIKKITTTTVTEMADGDAPTEVSHVAFLDRYLFGNELGTYRFHQADVGDPDSWSSVINSAESKFDDIQAIGTENLELYLLGEKSLEVWYNTGADNPFSRLPGGYIHSGTVAPYTFTFVRDPINSWVWLDQTHSLVRLEGRSTASLSVALNRYLQTGDRNFLDAMGDTFKVLGHTFYALHLPTQNETPVYDFHSRLWCNWSYYDTQAGEHKRWRGNCVALAPSWGKVLVGDRLNGKIYELDEQTYQDNGGTLRMMIRTGHMDRGDIGAWKFTTSVEFRAKKTDPGGGSTITAVLRYRNNGETTWSSEKTITLSAASGNLDYYARIRNLGRYRTRQWEIYISDNAPVALLPPIESYEITY
jgi:hypothetical protein